MFEEGTELIETFFSKVSQLGNSKDTFIFATGVSGPLDGHLHFRRELIKNWIESKQFSFLAENVFVYWSPNGAATELYINPKNFDMRIKVFETKLGLKESFNYNFFDLRKTHENYSQIDLSKVCVVLIKE